MQVMEQNCMVSVGGGFMKIQDYYDKNSFKQNIALFRLCKKNPQDGGFLKTLVTILRKSDIPEKIIAKYEAVDPAMWEKVGELFMKLSHFANEKRKR